MKTIYDKWKELTLDEARFRAENPTEEEQKIRNAREEKFRNTNNNSR